MGRKRRLSFAMKVPLVGALLLASANRALAADDHIFYLQKDGTNHCLTVDGSVSSVSEAYPCETDFDSQKFLFSQSSQKIQALANPNRCLQVSSNNAFTLRDCASAAAFTSPDLSGATLGLSLATFTANSNSHASQFTPLRSEAMADSLGNFPAVPFSDCVLPEFSLNDINAELHPKGVSGFQSGEKIYWQCKVGYRTIMEQSEVYSTCGANGWDTDLRLRSSRSDG